MNNATWISWTSAAAIAVGGAFAIVACSNDPANGTGTAGVVGGIDFGACFACGDMACPMQAASCDGAAGCRDLLNCAFSCEVGDVSCSQACVPANRAQELAQAAAVYPAYLACSITSCSSECSPSSPTTGGGNAGATGGGNAGATGSGNAGAGSGTAAPGTLVLGGEMGNYVSATENMFGIQGSFFAYADCDTNGDGVDDPASFSAFSCTSGWSLNTATLGQACISGTVGPREDMTNYLDWGAGFGLNLNEVMAAGATTGTAQPYDAAAHGVTGFSFDITGTSLPANTVVEFPTPTTTGTGEEHNARVRLGLNTISFASLAQADWVTTPQAFSLSQILAMKWKVESTTGTSPVSFCVSNIKPL